MSQSRTAPLSRRQQRKAEARARNVPFLAQINEMHRLGNRQMRQHAHAVSQHRVGDGWRCRKALWGEYYGRKLERLIRSGAPLAQVRAERIIIRSLLS